MLLQKKQHNKNPIPPKQTTPSITPYIPTQIDLKMMPETTNKVASINYQQNKQQYNNNEEIKINFSEEVLKNHPELCELIWKFDGRLREMKEYLRRELKKVKGRQYDQVDFYFQKTKTNKKEVLQSLENISNFINKIVKSLTQQQTNYFILKSTFQFFQKYFGSQKFQELDNFNKSLSILDFQSKLTCCLELLQGSLTLAQDITTQPKQKYQKAWSCIKFQPCGNQRKVAEGYQYLRKMMSITTSAVLDQQQKKGAFSKVMAFGLSYPQYFFNQKNRQLRSMVFNRKPTIELAQKIWNLPQNGLTAKLAKLSMKSIKTNIKIYIPLDQTKLPQNIQQFNTQSIKVRILHNDTIIQYRGSQNQGQNLVCCGSSQKIQPIKKIIIHLHGGGFLALSSRSMQSYTRKWARQLKVPVLSVDYRMPPFYRFPTAPLDCLTVYKFVVTHINKYFNIQPQEIVLAGDSAGGNLACSLMGLILYYRLPIPKGIFLAYPACDLRRIFSPSRIYSFTDPLLNPPMLLLCLRQYLNNKAQLQHNQIASPVLLTEQFIGGKKGDLRFPLSWPRTIIQVGAKDPLYDDSLRLVERLASSGIDCQCQVYANLSHGFLNLDFVIADCEQTIEDSVSHLLKFIN